MSARSQKTLQFTKQLKVMLGSGVPLVNALDLLSQDEDPVWAQVVDSVARDLMSGHPFSNALRKHPQYFPAYYVGTISTAEMSGQIVTTLSFLEEWLDREADLRARVKKALTYPCVVLTLAMVMVLILFNTVIPRLMDSFSSDMYGRSWPTEILILLTKILSGPVFYLLTAVAVVAVVAVIRSPSSMARLKELCYLSPVLGDLLSKAAVLRYISSFVLLLESGGQLITALKAAARSSGSPLLARDEERLVQGVSIGEPLSVLWTERPSLYPPVMVQMAKVGESASSLSSALRGTIPYLEMETHSRLERFVETIEPVLISGIALFIGFVAVAVILPISQMTANF